MFNKDFIRNDNGKIRNCDANIAKMNIFEYLIYKRFFISTMKDNFGYTLDLFKELGLFILFILLLIVAPISFPIIAYLHIRESKKNIIKYPYKDELKNIINKINLKGE